MEDLDTDLAANDPSLQPGTHWAMPSQSDRETHPDRVHGLSDSRSQFIAQHGLTDADLPADFVGLGEASFESEAPLESDAEVAAPQGEIEAESEPESEPPAGPDYAVEVDHDYSVPQSLFDDGSVHAVLNAAQQLDIP